VVLVFDNVGIKALNADESPKHSLDVLTLELDTLIFR
tara:strand:- start:609 stop:719 length:111 start_codon:yes stop_codon:yes gene_type:complete